ncbi:MAG: succinylglutamate desuccinylase/aspartoacylase family protein [Firmicutes bacterium]|nr:succinylglutamate desuccinylase/aspartoacylase family protein [Bacillota bacterium]
MVCIIVLTVSGSFKAMWEPDLIIPGPGVTRQITLSEYFPALAGTPGDTEVYVLEGAGPGGTVLVLGGVHYNEPGASVAAAVLVESATMDKGRLFVIPFTCKSGFTHSDPGEGNPQRFSIETPGELRTFKYGARAVNPVHSWPDSEVYVHYPSGQRLSGEETQNVNRAFPGRPDGGLAERIAYGVTKLIEAEGVDLTVDLHEAMPEYPNINVIVAHQRALPLAATAQTRMMLNSIQIALSPSPVNFHGLSHRELGDHTETLAVLMEAPNLTFGRLRSETSERIMVEGTDPFYEWGAKLGRLFVPFDEKGWPLEVRVARHVTGVHQLANALTMRKPGRAVTINVPPYAEIVAKGVGAFLNPPR